MATEQTLERRSATRYPIQWDLRYSPGDTTEEICAAQTVNMSSEGILFSGENIPSLGQELTLTIHAPRQSNDEPEFELVIVGHVVRATENSVALHFETCDFRTPGSRHLSAGDLEKIIWSIEARSAGSRSDSKA